MSVSSFSHRWPWIPVNETVFHIWQFLSQNNGFVKTNDFVRCCECQNSVQKHAVTKFCFGISAGFVLYKKERFGCFHIVPFSVWSKIVLLLPIFNAWCQRNWQICQNPVLSVTISLILIPFWFKMHILFSFWSSSVQCLICCGESA